MKEIGGDKGVLGRGSALPPCKKELGHEKQEMECQKVQLLKLQKKIKGSRLTLPRKSVRGGGLPTGRANGPVLFRDGTVDGGGFEKLLAPFSHQLLAYRWNKGD